MNLCFILDGILVVYAIILTVLYCRLRMVSNSKSSKLKKPPPDGGVYAGLYAPTNDTYETIGTDKKSFV